MTKKKEKGFTLIELIGVLVIMDILAIIVTPLVMNIIRKARVAADKRSIDAYGRSIELAIAGYLLDNGKFPTSIEDLTIEYSGNKVLCSTAQLNPDSSVYLTGCTVGGRKVDYAYGKDLTPPAPTYTAYTVGNLVTYNNVNYYVIANSGTSESSVTLLKAEPLTAQEISDYKPTEAKTKTVGVYTSMQYHLNSNVYDGSYVKTTVEAWKTAKASGATEVKLISLNDLKNNLGYVLDESATSPRYKPSASTPSWVYNSDYFYWTISPYEDSQSGVWDVGYNGNLINASVDDEHGTFNVVRPVIVLPKNAI